MKRLLVITGPTATGKSDLGIALAKKLNGEIISADSMQLYSGMVIGTAAVRPQEMQGIPHHMLGCISPLEDYSAAQYRTDVRKLTEQIENRNALPIVLGGTWLYIQALINRYDFAETKRNEGLRRQLNTYAQQHGPEALHKLLELENPQAAARLHPNDIKRVIRAIEIARSGATAAQNEPEPGLEVVKTALVCSDKEYLYQRINSRVDIMLEKGLLDEVRQLLDMGVDPEGQAFKAIGYRQLLPVINGTYALQDAAEDIKRESRRYAKRQMTWLRSQKDIHLIDICNKTKQQVLHEALEIIGDNTTWII